MDPGLRAYRFCALDAVKVKIVGGWACFKMAPTYLNGRDSLNESLLCEGFEASVDDSLVKIGFRLEMLGPYT